MVNIHIIHLLRSGGCVVFVAKPKTTNHRSLTLTDKVAKDMDLWVEEEGFVTDSHVVKYYCNCTAI